MGIHIYMIYILNDNLSREVFIYEQEVTHGTIILIDIKPYWRQYTTVIIEKSIYGFTRFWVTTHAVPLSK